jgi:hypothetical protein
MVYAVIGLDAGWSDPSAAEVIAGTLAGGGTATWAGNYVAPTADGTYDWPSAATGLTASTAYRIAIVWSDGNTPSNVAVGSFSSAGGGTTTLLPSVGGIDVNGNAPGLVSRLAPATGDVNVTGRVAALANRLAPATGNVNVTGRVPGLVSRLATDTADISVTGYTPTVSALSSSVDIAPTTGRVSVSGYVPDVVYPQDPGGGGRGGNAWHRRLRPDDYLPFLETVRTLRPVSGATGIVRGYVPKLSAIMQHDEPDLEIPEEVLAMVLELFEKWETA